MSDGVLTVLFERWTELAAQRSHLARGALFVPAPEPLPKPYAELCVLVVAPDDRWVEVHAQVVQIAPGVGVALAGREPRALERELATLLAAAQVEPDSPTAAGTMVHWGRPAWTEPEARAEEPLGSEPTDDAPAAGDEPLDEREAGDEDALEVDGPAGAATMLDQIRAMSSSEKLRLAAHGDRTARLLLLKDPNKTIQLHILQNKRITIEEVQHIAGNRQANPEALVRIGESREWLQNPGIVLALVSNPKTPSRTSLRLLRSLPQSEIRRLAKSPNVPQNIAQAARKLVVGG